MDKVKTIKPLTRGLPKTGQTYSIKADDDAALYRGWWLNRTVVGNKTRFIEQEFVVGEPVISDRATGLMWPKDLAGDATDSYSFKTWDDAMSFVAGLDYGGFDDWTIPNVFELATLYNGAATEPCFYDTIFSNVNPSLPYWTSSMKPFNSDYIHRVIFQYFLNIVEVARASQSVSLPCRVIRR